MNQCDNCGADEADLATAGWIEIETPHGPLRVYLATYYCDECRELWLNGELAA